jgi:hypothetical protein
MATRCRFENSTDIGVFSVLTNKYALTAIGGSMNFYSVFESELAETVPIVRTSIAGTRIIGRMCAGTWVLPLRLWPISTPPTAAGLPNRHDSLWVKLTHRTASIRQATRTACCCRALPPTRSYCIRETLFPRMLSCSALTRVRCRPPVRHPAPALPAAFSCSCGRCPATGAS